MTSLRDSAFATPDFSQTKGKERTPRAMLDRLITETEREEEVGAKTLEVYTENCKDLFQP